MQQELTIVSYIPGDSFRQNFKLTTFLRYET